MTEEAIKEIKKAAALFADQTYEVSHLVSHLNQVINDATKDATEAAVMFRNNMEKLLHYVEELRKEQIEKRNSKSVRDKKEETIDKMIISLHNAGFNTDRFKTVNTKKDLFSS